jgi:hypothetical protein
MMLLRLLRRYRTWEHDLSDWKRTLHRGVVFFTIVLILNAGYNLAIGSEPVLWIGNVFAWAFAAAGYTLVGHWWEKRQERSRNSDAQ